MATNEEQLLQEVIRRARVEMAQRETEDLVAIVMPRGIVFRTRDEVLAGFSDPTVNRVFGARAPHGQIHVLIVRPSSKEARTVPYDGASG
jgi:hypothetical protein